VVLADPKVAPADVDRLGLFKDRVVHGQHDHPVFEYVGQPPLHGLLKVGVDLAAGEVMFPTQPAAADDLAALERMSSREKPSVSRTWFVIRWSDWSRCSRIEIFSG
jgi:hypothetical protein